MFSYTFATIDVPGSSITSANGMNNSGQIVGSYADSAGHTHGFLDTRGSFSTINVPGATSTSANGINNFGDIVGNFVDNKGMEHGFLDHHGHFTNIDAPGATTYFGIANGTSANGINDNGQIVGSYWGPTNGPPHPDGTKDGIAEHAFVDSHCRFASIGTPQNYGAEGIAFFSATGINNHGQIVGNTTTAPAGSTYGWVDTHGTLTPISRGFLDAPANGINNNGQVVGSVSTLGSDQLGYVDTNGMVTTINVPGSSHSSASGINDFGRIVGNSSQGAFLATPLTTGNVLGPTAPAFLLRHPPVAPAPQQL